MKKIQLEIGQKLYKYSTFYLLEYEVTGILERKEGLYYEIKYTPSHNDGRPKNLCEIMIKVNEVNKLVYVAIATEDKGNDDDSEYYWHDTEDSDYYQLSKIQALECVLKRQILECQENIKNFKEKIKNNEENIIKYKEQIKAL